MGETPIDDRELRDLMTRYQNADAAAVEELVVRISPPLLRFSAVPVWHSAMPKICCRTAGSKFIARATRTALPSL